MKLFEVLFPTNFLLQFYCCLLLSQCIVLGNGNGRFSRLINNNQNKNNKSDNYTYSPQTFAEHMETEHSVVVTPAGTLFELGEKNCIQFDVDFEQIRRGIPIEQYSLKAQQSFSKLTENSDSDSINNYMQQKKIIASIEVKERKLLASNIDSMLASKTASLNNDAPQETGTSQHHHDRKKRAIFIAAIILVGSFTVSAGIAGGVGYGLYRGITYQMGVPSETTVGSNFQEMMKEATAGIATQFMELYTNMYISEIRKEMQLKAEKILNYLMVQRTISVEMFNGEKEMRQFLKTLMPQHFNGSIYDVEPEQALQLLTVVPLEVVSEFTIRSRVCAPIINKGVQYDLFDATHQGAISNNTLIQPYIPQTIAIRQGAASIKNETYIMEGRCKYIGRGTYCDSVRPIRSDCSMIDVSACEYRNIEKVDTYAAEDGIFLQHRRLGKTTIVATTATKMEVTDADGVTTLHPINNPTFTIQLPEGTSMKIGNEIISGSAKFETTMSPSPKYPSPTFAATAAGILEVVKPTTGTFQPQKLTTFQQIINIYNMVTFWAPIIAGAILILVVLFLFGFFSCTFLPRCNFNAFAARDSSEKEYSRNLFSHFKKHAQKMFHEIKDEAEEFKTTLSNKSVAVNALRKMLTDKDMNWREKQARLELACNGLKHRMFGSIKRKLAITGKKLKKHGGLLKNLCKDSQRHDYPQTDVEETLTDIEAELQYMPDSQIEIDEEKEILEERMENFRRLLEEKRLYHAAHLVPTAPPIEETTPPANHKTEQNKKKVFTRRVRFPQLHPASSSSDDETHPRPPPRCSTPRHHQSASADFKTDESADDFDTSIATGIGIDFSE